MEVITIESGAFKEILKQLQEIRNEINNINEKKCNESWLSSLQVQETLGISSRTWQTYRDRKMIRYSQIGSKIYVKAEWLTEFLENHSIKTK